MPNYFKSNLRMMFSGPYIPSGMSSNGRSLTSREIVTAFLFSGSGTSFQRHAGASCQMSQNSIKKAVDMCINVMHEHFVPQYIVLPTSEEAIQEALDTYTNTGFWPIGWGGIDGTLVLIINPPKTKRKMFISRKGTTALTVTIVAGPSGRIYAASANNVGKTHDASVLRRSSIWELMENQKWKPFPGAILLGDSAYMTKLSWLATPYHEAIAKRDRRKAKYNAKFVRARNCVEQV